MSMECLEIAPKKKKEISETHHGAPRKPEMVLDIIECRDKHHMTWQDIGDIHGMTRAGARHLYQRWHDWSKEEELSS